MKFVPTVGTVAVVEWCHGDARDEVIYIGSSNELRRRLREHFCEGITTCIKRHAVKYRLEYTTHYQARKHELYDDFARANGRPPRCNEARPTT